MIVAALALVGLTGCGQTAQEQCVAKLYPGHNVTKADATSICHDMTPEQVDQIRG